MTVRISISGMGAVTGLGFGVPALAEGLAAGGSAIRRLNPGEIPSLAAPRWAAIAPDLDENTLRGRIAALLPQAVERNFRALRGGRRSIWLGALAAAEAMAMAGREAVQPDEQLGLVVAGNNLFPAYTAAMVTRLTYAPRPEPRYGYEMFDSHAVGVLSAVFGCRGAGATVGAASASGLAALVAAVDMLAAGRVSRCLVVGLPTDFGVAEWAGLDLIGALGDERRIGNGPASRPFDAAASGFIPGEAAAALLLERSDVGLAHIAAAELTLDGTHLPAPNPEGETRVMRRACDAAGLTPADIDLISAHATSTPLGDRVEADAIATVFAEAPNLLVNATKGLIGHALNAAGLVETVATLIQMRDGFVHPNIGLVDPVRPLPYAGAVAVRRPTRRAMKTAFGFGGFNAALILEKE
ncbi:beta-ketoacyl synthase N-terminal-like domain-containing protein [Azospirillum sp. B4]|uniref:beta-ketoacyl synthase N-terminal-like domain-containing protein n=1 Tax=Azospirillum sp. B4 TaxID=95605 RepID=UPI000349F5D8|nr:beta-ketoacyl synthase N-terminal-like domain-containing protein [Azospirillum sp. B4]